MESYCSFCTLDTMHRLFLLQDTYSIHQLDCSTLSMFYVKRVFVFMRINVHMCGCVFVYKFSNQYVHDFVFLASTSQLMSRHK